MRTKSGETVVVVELPKCNFCDGRAEYDFRSKAGPWAFGCRKHWEAYRAHPVLGVGAGQRLVLKCGANKDEGEKT